MRALLLASVLVAGCRSAEPRAAGRVSALASGLDAKDAAARASAAFALGQLAMGDAPSEETPQKKSVREAATAALIPAASDPDAEVRRAAVEALGKSGAADAEDALLSAATDSGPGVRGATALALFRRRFLKRVPDYSTAAFTALDMLSSDPDPEVRWRAVYGFTRFAEPRAKETLVKSQKDGDARVRLFAARALGKLGARPDYELFSDPDQYVRAEAVTACGLAKGACEVPVAAFTDKSAHVRAAAADAAGGYALPLVEKMAESDTAMPRGRALLAVAKGRGEAAASLLARARADSDWWVRSKAYEASAGLTGGADILRAGVKDADARVASSALETLAASSAPFVDEVLTGVLRDPRAPLELLGTAADAAGERKSAALADPLFEAARRSAALPAEVRDGMRKSLEAIAGANPSRKASIEAGLKALPAPKDAAKVFPRLSTAPTLVLDTMKGRVELKLDTAAAPNTSAAIAAMAKKGLYDGLIWHRVVTAFVVQGGDPRGSGWGDAGYRLDDELSSVPFLRGTLGMPKAGPDTGGCQLFVSLVPTPHLDGRYTAFGKVTAGMEVLDQLEPGDRILKAFLK